MLGEFGGLSKRPPETHQFFQNNLLFRTESSSDISFETIEAFRQEHKLMVHVRRPKKW